SLAKHGRDGCPNFVLERWWMCKILFQPNKRWLHEEARKEGWSKASKLEGKRAKEGLISLFVGDKAAVMVEVNCETDFVPRNEKFQQLVKDVAFATMVKTRLEYVKLHLSLFLALTVGDEADGDGGLHIGYYIHSGVAMGDTAPSWCSRGGKDRAQDTLGRKLGHPVVGEAPKSLGSTEDLPCRDTETCLLPQSFLPDPSRTVAQYLTEQGARVMDFVRFQCCEAGSDGA
uniref:Elongation factor Ts, mitochondrial n=1 Tax=Hucho hucho TaxID=62062 RepID=A0A4W5QTZ8_9TELE